MVSDRDWRAISTTAVASGRAQVGDSTFIDGPAIYVGTREVAHIDAEGALDVRLTKAEIRRRRDVLRSDPRIVLRASSSDWLEVWPSTPEDVTFATELVISAIDANEPSAPPGLPPSGHDLRRRRRFH
jgi:hypothetical protein